MNTFKRRAEQFLRADDGPTATEYAVMLGLIIVLCMGAITSIGSTTEGVFESLDEEMAGAGTPDI